MIPADAPDSVEGQRRRDSTMGATDTSEGQIPEGTIQFTCQCGKVHILKAAFAGKTALCDQCGANFTVPTETASESAAAPERNAPLTFSSEDNVPQVVPSMDSHEKTRSNKTTWLVVTLAGVLALIVWGSATWTPSTQPKSIFKYRVGQWIAGKKLGSGVWQVIGVVPTEPVGGLYSGYYTLHQYADYDLAMMAPTQKRRDEIIKRSLYIERTYYPMENDATFIPSRTPDNP
jgi:hypothetical protein